MSQLKAGFARVNITPMMGISMQGYYHERLAEGVLDELEIVALALEEGGKRAVLLTVDNIEVKRECALPFRTHISEVTGVDEEYIYMAATHTHTGPYLRAHSGDELQDEYFRFVYHRIADAARFALDDLKPAKAGWGVGVAPEIAFIRRYKMKDGTTQTNPARNDPNLDHPIGEPDHRVSVLRFDREGGDHIVLANIGIHPDVIGGSKISGDWPAFTRREVEKFIDNSKCIFFNGPQGDINHIDFHPTRTEKDFMDEGGAYGGYGHARYMGRAVAGTIVQVYDKAQAMQDVSLRCMQKTIQVPANRPTPEQLPEARYIYDMWKAGRANELPYTGMMNTTVVAEACRMLNLEHGPDFFDMTVSAVALGKVVLVGLPGEPFSKVGHDLKKTPGWDLIIPTCLTNGSEAYFPTQEAYDEGGYESRCSEFKPGIAEQLTATGQEIMRELAK